MGQALYRKYRSKSFDEVVGQDHITKTLTTAIKSGRISHAYLFTGPRGVGKTSVARILAHEVNGLSYGGEQAHLDIIEIDAASNRRIDEIRDLREKVHITPTSSKYKVYIIDEVHMLTKEAFNALLKTLEEPPAHVIFILATTEAHKLPETIVSRTQRYSFKPLSMEVASSHLADVAKKEKIVIDKESLDMLAEFGEGSLRDSLSLLDQLASTNKKIDAAAVRLQLGLPKQESIINLVDLTFSGDSSKIIDLILELRNEGNEASAVAKMLSKELRRRLTDGNLPEQGISLLKSLAQISAGGGTLEMLELALLEVSGQIDKPSETKKEVDHIAPEPEQKSQPAKQKPIAGSSSSNFDLTMWEDVLAKVKLKNASIYTALRLAVPALTGDTLTLAFEFGLHQKKITHAAAKNLVASVIEDISGSKIAINCEVDKTIVRKAEEEPPKDFYTPDTEEPSLQNISNIFGSAEVLES